MRRPKYRKGPLVTSVSDVAEEVVVLHRCLYLNDKVQNASWISNMSLATIDQYVRHNRVWYAVENTEDDADFREVD